MDFGQIGTAYDFIGIHFDHFKKTASLASKTMLKLPKQIPSTMTAREFEGMVGRFIFGAGVHQLPLINFWWCLKFAKRIFNKLNRGLLNPNDNVEIPHCVRGGFGLWLKHLRVPHVVNFSNNKQKSATLFTDATLNGWGAVYISDNNEISVVGGKFAVSKYDHLINNNNINANEAAALDLALNALREKINGLDHINIFVDNTSVISSVCKGNTQSEDLVAPIKNILSQLIDKKIQFKVNYVNTKINPADEISRGKTFDINKIEIVSKTNELAQTIRKGRKGGKAFISQT
jgi:hypothetical protein